MKDCSMREVEAKRCRVLEMSQNILISSFRAWLPVYLYEMDKENIEGKGVMLKTN